MSPTTRHTIRGIAALLCMTAGIALMSSQCENTAMNGLLVLAGVALVAVALQLCGGKKCCNSGCIRLKGNKNAVPGAEAEEYCRKHGVKLVPNRECVRRCPFRKHQKALNNRSSCRCRRQDSSEPHIQPERQEGHPQDL